MTKLKKKKSNTQPSPQSKLHKITIDQMWVYSILYSLGKKVISKIDCVCFTHWLRRDCSLGAGAASSDWHLKISSCPFCFWPQKESAGSFLLTVLSMEHEDQGGRVCSSRTGWFLHDQQQGERIALISKNSFTKLGGWMQLGWRWPNQVYCFAQSHTVLYVIDEEAKNQEGQ